MALPTNIDICANYVVVQSGNPTDAKTLITQSQIGTVRAIGWQVTWCAVGDIIMYKTAGAVAFSQNGNEFSVIVQESVVFIYSGFIP